MSKLPIIENNDYIATIYYISKMRECPISRPVMDKRKFDDDAPKPVMIGRSSSNGNKVELYNVSDVLEWCHKISLSFAKSKRDYSANRLNEEPVEVTVITSKNRLEHPAGATHLVNDVTPIKVKALVGGKKIVFKNHHFDGWVRAPQFDYLFDKDKDEKKKKKDDGGVSCAKYYSSFHRDYSDNGR